MKRWSAGRVVAGVIAPGCGKSREAAEATTGTFPARCGRGQCAEIYRDSTPELRPSIGGPLFVAMIQLQGYDVDSPALVTN